MTENQLAYYIAENGELGFRLYKINDTNARCLTKSFLAAIYLKMNNGKPTIYREYINSNLYSFKADLDLTSYSNSVRFKAEKDNFMNKNNIYSFQINKESSTNYFKLYDYKENNIKKLLGYYNKTNENIIFLYQTLTHIKYFTFINNNSYIQKINSNSISNIFEPKSNQEILYDINDLFNDSTFGNLNVYEVKRYINGKIKTETFGNNFYELLIQNNKIIIGKYHKSWYNYSLSFFDHIENEYTRIYYLNNINIIVKTCYSYKCSL